MLTRMRFQVGLRRGVGRGSASSSDAPGVTDISELLSSVEEDAERAGEVRELRSNDARVKTVWRLAWTSESAWCQKYDSP
jgi:hypothetical protein